MTRASRLLPTTLAMALVLGACATQPPPAAFREPVRQPYRLASGDKLRVIVFGQDNLSNVYTVDSTGRIAMPLAGAIPVSGATTQQLERTIEAKLRAGYIREPRVAVEVETYRPFFILGEVTNSGQFPFINGMTVQTAVAIAGGFTPRGNQNAAQITRLIQGRSVTVSVPPTEPVRPGDTVVIKERWF